VAFGFFGQSCVVFFPLGVAGYLRITIGRIEIDPSAQRAEKYRMFEPAILMRVIFFLLVCVSVSWARIGENETQCNGRYGTPLTDKFTADSDKKNPLLPIGYTKTYKYQGWKVRIAYFEFNGPAVKMSFQKKSSGAINEGELAAILTANTPAGMTWKRGVYTKSPLKGAAGLLGNLGANAMGAGAWQRSDGVHAILAPLMMEFSIETPEAVAIVKRAKEISRKEAIPSF